MDAHRESALVALLDAVVAGTVVGHEAPAGDRELQILADTLSGRWGDAAVAAAGLDLGEPDGDERWLRRAVVTWAMAGDPGPASDVVLTSALDDLPDPATPIGRFAAHLLVEGLMAHARLDLADRVAAVAGPALGGPLVLDGHEHAFGTMARICGVRVLAFRGELAAAGEALAEIDGTPPGPLTAVLAATECLVRGNQADPADVRRLVADVDRHAPAVVDHLTAGAHMLAAFGLIALGDVDAAARRVLLAGGDDDLSRLDVIDRALGLEMLVVLALVAGDLDAAHSWADRATVLLASPIADSTVARVQSRLALAERRHDDAVAWGERAVARAREVDRVIEYAEGEVVLGRARLAHRGTGGVAAAARSLEAMVAAAEARGHLATRRAASRTLRPAGVRLRPLAGSGWGGLSEREAEVARLVVDGVTNGEVAVRLQLSEHTVRAHVSRVLAAFGVATRAGLPAVAGTLLDRTPLRPLTRRQAEVAVLVAEGLGNRAIGERLGLSTRTVERHVADILVRWDLTSRTAIAREVAAGGR